MEPALVLDALIVALLAVAIGLAVRLDRRLRGLRAERDEFMRLTQIFADATQRAEAGTAALKAATQAAVADLQPRLEAARAQVDDLRLISEQAASIAARIESGASAATARLRRDRAEMAPAANRDQEDARPRAPAPVSSPPARAREPRLSSTERDLLAALDGLR